MEIGNWKLEMSRRKSSRKDFRRCAPAFTLVELVITIAIIGIMTAVMIVSLSGQKVKKEVETEAIRVESIIREAQNYALTGKGIGGTEACDRFTVRSAAGGTVLLIYYSDLSSGSCAPASSSPLSYPIENGVSFATAASVSFTLPHGQVFNASGGEMMGSDKVRFTVAKGGVRWSVCVYPLGRIDRVVGDTCP